MGMKIVSVDLVGLIVWSKEWEIVCEDFNEHNAIITDLFTEDDINAMICEESQQRAFFVPGIKVDKYLNYERDSG